MCTINCSRIIIVINKFIKYIIFSIIVLTNTLIKYATL